MHIYIIRPLTFRHSLSQVSPFDYKNHCFKAKF